MFSIPLAVGQQRLHHHNPYKMAALSNTMKFAHFADLHLGSWREPKLRDLSSRAFHMAIEECVRQQVDFILFAGDIFDTSLPSFETLKLVTRKLKELQKKSIPIYAIPGSHDFSPTGKTMIDVLQEAGLLKNVAEGRVEEGKLKLEFTIDQKTGVKITGLPGRKGQLDRLYYEHLLTQHLEQEPGYKIFLFHTTISEMKPKHLENIESQPVSFLPKNFSYYAGGHIHHPTNITLPGYGTLTYPGALFPNNFKEIEQYGNGGFYLIENDTFSEGNTISWIPIKAVKHHALTINCNHKSPEVVSFELREQLRQVEVNDALITLRLEGQLASGKSADIPLKDIFQQLYERGAYWVMKNTAGLTSEEFEEISLQHDAAHLEENVIREHLQQHVLFSKEKELQLITSLLAAWNTTKKEGETIYDFQQRVLQEGKVVLELGKGR